MIDASSHQWGAQPLMTQADFIFALPSSVRSLELSIERLRSCEANSAAPLRGVVILCCFEDFDELRSTNTESPNSCLR
jgi:hypothetical protein